MTELKNAIKQAVKKQKDEIRQATIVEFLGDKVIIRLEYTLTDMEKETVKVFIEEGIEKALDWIHRERKHSRGNKRIPQ